MSYAAGERVELLDYPSREPGRIVECVPCAAGEGTCCDVMLDRQFLAHGVHEDFLKRKDQ